MPNKKQKKPGERPKRRREIQSAVLPIYKKRVFLVSTRRSGRWVIPKGVIEPRLTPQDSAAQEALEEAGLKGRVKSKEIGRYKYRKWGRTYRVQVFVMKVEKVKSQWKEMKERKRRLLEPKAAVKKVYPRKLKRIITEHFNLD